MVTAANIPSYPRPTCGPACAGTWSRALPPQRNPRRYRWCPCYLNAVRFDDWRCVATIGQQISQGKFFVMAKNSEVGLPWPRTPEEVAMASPQQYPSMEVGFVCECGARARTNVRGLASKFPDEQTIGSLTQRYRCHACRNPPKRIMMAERIYWNEAERAASILCAANDG